MSVQDRFSHWRNAVKARNNNTPLPPIRDGEPQSGYYRTRKIKDGPWLPVAIYYDRDDLIVLVDGLPLDRESHNKMWLYCARHPVTFEEYEHRITEGHWPGEIAAPREAEIGDNAPPPESVDDTLRRAVLAAGQWVGAHPEITSDEEAGAASTMVNELRKLRSAVAKIHETEKAPHLEKCREIDDKYLPLCRDDKKKPGAAMKAITALLVKINGWADKKAAAERARIAAEEAARQKALDDQRKRDEEAAAAKAQALPIAKAPKPVVVPPPPAPAARPSFGGVVGNRISQRTRTIAVVVDQDAVYKHFRDNPMLTGLLQSLAQKAIDGKQEVPGVTTKEETYSR